jgi:ribosomal protein S18 acetylase RimI-like enzyme
MNVDLRRFDGSLSDAQGVLAVEQATFDETHYRAEQIRSILSDGPQRCWVAIGQGRVVGVIIAFPIGGLRGKSWEVDFLAVLPDWRGRRIATELIRAARSFGAQLAHWSRSVVATDNAASSRAFLRAGYQTDSEPHTLLVCQAKALAAGDWPEPGLDVHEVSSLDEARDWFRGNVIRRLGSSSAWPTSLSWSDWFDALEHQPPNGMPDNSAGFYLLVAELDGEIVGHAELVEVQTLLYRGIWIESLAAVDRPARFALIRSALNRARGAGLDEIGALVPRSDPRLHQALAMNGFGSLGEYHWHTAKLLATGSGADPQPTRA